jgi:hypothetical protein
MSYDPKLQNPCDHRINWESYPLEDDLRTVILGYPVAAVKSFSLRINNVVIDPNLYNVHTTRKPLSLVLTTSVFMDNKIKDWQPLIEVSYVTYVGNCPKCLALKTVDDVVYSSAGDFKMANKEYLLVQQVEKAIITKVNSNPFHDWYGTSLHTLIGTKITDLDFIKTKIREQVSGAIEKLKNVQKQLLSSQRKIDPGELFGQLLKIDIAQTDDPTIIMVTVIFTSQSNQTLEFSQLIDLSALRERVAFV